MWLLLVVAKTGFKDVGFRLRIGSHKGARSLALPSPLTLARASRSLSLSLSHLFSSPRMSDQVEHKQAAGAGGQKRASETRAQRASAASCSVCAMGVRSSSGVLMASCCLCLCVWTATTAAAGGQTSERAPPPNKRSAARCSACACERASERRTSARSECAMGVRSSSGALMASCCLCLRVWTATTAAVVGGVGGDDAAAGGGAGAGAHGSAATALPDVLLVSASTSSLRSLTQRADMRHPVLLGRKFLKKKFIVDVSKVFLSSKQA